MCRWYNEICDELNDSEDLKKKKSCPGPLHVDFANGKAKNFTEAELAERRVQVYWGVYTELLNKLGAFASAYKLAINAAEGVYPTQVVRYDYYKGAANLEIAVAERKREVWRQIAVLNEWLCKMGEVVPSKEGWKKFLNWAMTERRRTALRGKAQRSSKKGEFISPEELVNWYEERHPDDMAIENFNAK